MNKIKQLIKSTNLNYKKEMTFNITVNSVLLVATIFLLILSKNILYFWPCLLLLIIFNLTVLYRYTLIKNKNDEKEIIDVKNIISFLYLDLNKGCAVDEALSNLKSIASLKSIELIKTLLSKTKKNDDLIYYLEFAKQYKSINIVNLMCALYKYKTEKTNDNLILINDIILEIEDSINSRKIETNKFEIIKTSPIIGAFIAVLIFVISIVLITGNYIHG